MRTAVAISLLLLATLPSFIDLSLMVVLEYSARAPPGPPPGYAVGRADRPGGVFACEHILGGALDRPARSLSAPPNEVNKMAM